MPDVVIIGSGPAGLSAAIYAKRSNLTCVVTEMIYNKTGQIVSGSRVDNYLGLLGVSGYELGEMFRKHAEKFNVDFVEDEVVDISYDNITNLWTSKLKSGKEINSKSIIFAGGCIYRKLGIESEDNYIGRGISYCAVCDAMFYKDKDVAVIGGGNTALDEAKYLSEICRKVYLVHRREEFRGAYSTLAEIKNKSNVEIVTNSQVTNIQGEKKVENIVLNNSVKIKVEGVFLAIGMIPNTKLLKKFDILDDGGYVISNENCTTDVGGLFVAGDARTKKLRQVVTAVSDGANAINSVIEYLK